MRMDGTGVYLYEFCDWIVELAVLGFFHKRFTAPNAEFFDISIPKRGARHFYCQALRNGSHRSVLGPVASTALTKALGQSLLKGCHRIR
jgi:hypothetical protein